MLYMQDSLQCILSSHVIWGQDVGYEALWIKME